MFLRVSRRFGEVTENHSFYMFLRVSRGFGGALFKSTSNNPPPFSKLQREGAWHTPATWSNVNSFCFGLLGRHSGNYTFWITKHRAWKLEVRHPQKLTSFALRRLGTASKVPLEPKLQKSQTFNIFCCFEGPGSNEGRKQGNKKGRKRCLHSLEFWNAMCTVNWCDLVFQIM